MIERLIANDNTIDPKIKKSILELLEQFPQDESNNIDEQINKKIVDRDNAVLARENIMTQLDALERQLDALEPQLDKYSSISYVTALVAMILPTVIPLPAAIPIVALIVAVICYIRDEISCNNFETQAEQLCTQGDKITEDIDTLNDEIKHIQDPTLDAWSRAVNNPLREYFAQTHHRSKGLMIERAAKQSSPPAL